MSEMANARRVREFIYISSHSNVLRICFDDDFILFYFLLFLFLRFFTSLSHLECFSLSSDSRAPRALFSSVLYIQEMSGDLMCCVNMVEAQQ